MNVLDNHITDLDNRIIEICKIAPTVDQSSIQESLSSYGWILLDSWIAWRTLRFLIKDQDIKPDIQKKWFQTPSSFTASQIKAVWKFGENVDFYLNKIIGHGLKNIIDNEIEKMRNSSAHFSDSGIIKGSDHQKIKKYHDAFSNIFLLYEIFSFFCSLSLNVFYSNKSSLIFVDDENKNVLKIDIESEVKEFDFEIIDVKNISVIKMEFVLNENEVCLCFDRDGCYFRDGVDKRIKIYNLFSNKGYYRDISILKGELNRI